MPSATTAKLSQLRSQLQQCSDPTAAKALQSAIAKLESQLASGQPQTQASKIAQRQAALKRSQVEDERRAAQQQRTILKPPSLNKAEPKPEAIQEFSSAPVQDDPPAQTKAPVQKDQSSAPTQDSPPAQPDATPKITKRFPSQAIAAAKQLVLADDLWQRPQVQGITIDGPESRDLDDAIWIEPTESGAIVSVHIADVSELVEIDSILDKVAIARTTTRYFGTGNAPMLPRPLSEDKLSLLEFQERPTMTIRVTLDNNAQITDVNLFESWIASQKRFTYAEAAQLDSQPAFQDTLELAHQWASHLYQNRLTSGAIGATQTAQGQWLTEEGSLSQVKHSRSHLLVQEFMILANRAVAQWLADQDIPALYRNHTPRAIAPDREAMNQALMALGSGAAIRKRLAGWLNRAEYGPALVGHFALNLPAYCHFTSPIRRLADLINHRIVKALLKQQDSPYTTSDLEQLGQHIAQVKRQEEDRASEYFKAERQKLYQEQIQDPEELDCLGSKEFSRLLKYATQQQDFERLRSELVTRLDAGRLAIQDLYFVLFQSDDGDIQQQILQYLTNHTHDAVSVISIASTQEDGWEEFDYIELENRSPFTVWLEVKRAGESLTTVHPVVHPRKQTARHLACLSWLKDYLQDALVSPEERIEPELPEPELESDSPSASKGAAPLSKAMQTALLKPLNDGQNFVGMLMDVCQTLRWDTPEYEIHDSDDWFIGECVLFVQGQRLEGRGVATKRKLAKSLAAKEVLEQLRELAPEHWDEWFPGTGQPPGLGGSAEESVGLVGGATGNPISELQEICQQQQIAMPVYEFETTSEGFRCTVQAMGVQGTGEGGSKKEAKVGAAVGVLKRVVSKTQAQLSPSLAK